MENGVEIIKKFKKKDTLLIVVTVVLILMTVAAFGYNYWSQTEKLPEPIEFIDCEKAGQYGKLDVAMITEEFASYGTDDNVQHYFYFAQDGKYMYILSLGSTDINKLQPIYDYMASEEEEPEVPAPIEVRGMSKRIPEDLKKLAIEAYNEMMEEDFLTQENFEEYFGEYYLDTKTNPKVEQSSIAIMVGVFAGVFAIVFLILSIQNKTTTDHSMRRLRKEEEEDTLYRELEDDNNDQYSKLKTIMTKNYILSYFKGMEIINFKEVAWVYPFKYKVNGINTYNSIIIVTNDKKKHEVAKSSASGKSKEQYEELYVKIQERIPNVLYGYTPENKKEMKNR